LGARYYIPKLGRFLTRDPMGQVGGSNSYAYSDNNPLIRVDADGTDWNYWSEVGGVFTGYGRALAGIVTGPIQLAQYRLRYGFTAESDAFLIASSYHGFMGGLIGDRGSEGFGESFGTILIAAATLGPKASMPKLAGSFRAGGVLKAAVQRFSSFRAFKQEFGSAGTGNVWHHIVEQNKTSQFAPEQIHSTENVIKLPVVIHDRISGYYNSIQPFTGGLRVRQWLNGKSFEYQYRFGLDVMKRFGGK